jgi:hypothetical protein
LFGKLTVEGGFDEYDDLLLVDVEHCGDESSGGVWRISQGSGLGHTNPVYGDDPPLALAGCRSDMGLVHCNHPSVRHFICFSTLATTPAAVISPWLGSGAL